MANNRRVIRKVTTQTQLVVDEQFWPVILALFILCGFSMGAVVAYLPFGARRTWMDATTWLFVIPVTTCAAIWILRYLPSRVVRRILQISFVLCLVVHLILLIVSLESGIFNRIWEQTARPTAVRQQRQPRVISVYQSHQLDQRLRPQQDFVRPVETTVPDPVEERVERTEEARNEPPIQQPPMPAPQTPRDIQPNAIERPTPAETRPRQSDDASRLSRQLAESRPQPNQPIRVPSVASPQAQSSSLEARGDTVRQQSAETQANRIQTATETAAPSRDTPMIAHRANERAPTTDTRSAPMLPRQLAQPTAVPQVDVRTGENPAIARQTVPGELEPARTTTPQQLTASPRTSPVAELTNMPQAAPTSTPTPRREQPSPAQPQLAQTPAPAANRQPRTTTRPDAASAAAAIATNAQPDPAGAQNIEAAAATISRQATAPPVPAASAAAAAVSSTNPRAPVSSSVVVRQSTNAIPSTNSSVVAASPRTASAARAVNAAAVTGSPTSTSGADSSTAALSGNSAGLQRQQQPTAAAGAAAGVGAAASPTTAPSVAMAGERAQSASASTATTTTSANHLARTTRSSQVATSTRLAQAPSAVTADAGGEQPEARPSRLAMSQSLGGIAGVGQTANLDRSPSTPSSPSTSASGSANRAEATQNLPPGPALAPSSSSLARRSLVGSDRPSASLRASTSSVAEAAGANRPAELNASSGASMIQQAANAPAGTVTAAKGNVDIDLGPTRIADAGGFERASGGGQPVIHFDNDGPSLARSQSGGPAPFAVATTTVDAVTASPSSASQPSSSEIASGSTAVGQSLQSGPAANNAGETAGLQLAGTTAGSGERVAATTMTRSNQSAGLPATETAGTAEAGDEAVGRRLARTASNAGSAGSLAGPVAAAPTAASSNTSELAATAPAQNDGGISRQISSSGAAAGQPDQIAASATVSGGDTVGPQTLQRAEAVDAISGPAVAGGGTSAPQRTATATREFTTNVTAETMTLSGSPASGGSPAGSDIAAQGGAPSPTATGTMGRASNSPVGAVASDMPRDAALQGGMDLVAGSSQRSSATGDSPAIGEATASAAPIARSGMSQFNASTSVVATPTIPSSPTSIAVDGSELNDAAIGSGSSLATQQSTAALPIEVAALDGVGGLGDRLTLDVGVNSRLASSESMEVQTTPSRFMRQEVGGAPQLNTSAVFAADAFRNRAPSRGDLPNRGGSGSGGPQTEEAIELGLTFLSRRQLSDGSWTLHSATEPVQLGSDTAATGLCLLAFQGAGYNHREFKYKDQVSAGIEYLLKNQKPDGDLFVPLDDISNRSVWLYSHGIASIALCEAYGMTQDPKLKDPAKRRSTSSSHLKTPRQVAGAINQVSNRTRPSAAG